MNKKTAAFLDRLLLEEFMRHEADPVRLFQLAHQLLFALCRDALKVLDHELEMWVLVRQSYG
jgi:hypothetical protein